MINLTQEDQDRLNLHYNGFTIDESKGPESIIDEVTTMCITEVLPSGITAHLFYDCVADHVYVYRIT